jgi:hypothetical protein
MKHYYTYYSHEEWGRGYIGKRSCDCLPEEDVEYFGTFSDKTFKPTQKIILRSDYENAEELAKDEVILHDFYDVARSPHFANKAKQTSTGFDRTGTTWNHSDETKQLLSELLSGEKNPMFGKTPTDRSRQLMSEAHMGEKNSMFGKTHTDETKRRLSERAKGLYAGENNPNFGNTGEKSPVFGFKWYVNMKGETCLCKECPGPEWQSGRKWKDQ